MTLKLINNDIVIFFKNTARMKDSVTKSKFFIMINF
jgi:hypothetical protein